MTHGFAGRRGRLSGFTLIEVMIVIGIISIVVAIAASTWMRQRETARGRACQENLTKIAEAKELYAVEFKLSSGTNISFPDDLLRPGGVQLGRGYFRVEPKCDASGIYLANPIGTNPSCSIGSNNVSFEPHILPQ